MRMIVRSPIAWAALILVVLFILLKALLPQRLMLEVLRLLQTTMAIAVVTAYWPAALAIVRRGRADLGEHLILGIVLAFIGVALSGVWALLWRLSDEPAWMYQSDFNGFLVYLSILACLLHITAPGAIDGRVPTRNWIALGMAAGAAFFAAGIILVSRPNARAIVDVLEHWLR